MNEPHKKISVYTTKPSEIILNNDTLNTVDNKVILIVERRNENLNIQAIADSMTKTFEVEPINSFHYWGNIFTNYGIGMLVDRNNPKRYSYPRRIYLNSSDTSSQYYRYSQADNKGELKLHVSIPYINTFKLNPINEGTKINTNFWGLTLGIDYYHSINQFINLGFSGISGVLVPVPAPITLSGEFEIVSSSYVSISNNYRIRRFSLGYGLSYARNTWDFKYFDQFDPPPPTREPIRRSHNSFGVLIPAYYQFGESFHLGLIYRPTFYRPQITDKIIKYEHLLSVDFAWKIRLK